MNNEGKMFCDIGRRYNRSGSFLDGNTNFKQVTEFKTEAEWETDLGYKVVFQAGKFKKSQPGGYYKYC